MRGVPADRRGGAALAAPWLWWQWFFARRPQAGGGLDADNIGQADFCDAVTEICVIAVSRVSQHGLCLHPGGDGGTQLVQCDLRLGLEDNLLRHAGGRTPVGGIGPFPRQL